MGELWLGSWPVSAIRKTQDCATDNSSEVVFISEPGSGRNEGRHGLASIARVTLVPCDQERGAEDVKPAELLPEVVSLT